MRFACIKRAAGLSGRIARQTPGRPSSVIRIVPPPLRPPAAGATPRKCWAPRAARRFVHQQLRAYSPSKVPRPGALGKTVEKSARPSGPNRDAESERRLITAPSTATSARREACKTSPIAEDPTSTASKRHTFYVLFKQTEEAPWNTAQTPAVSGFDD